MRKALFAIAASLATLAAAAPAQAVTYTYIGSWQVDDGPDWGSTSIAYTGQEAAAFLFGGSAGDYAISTIDSLVANIDHLTWVSTWAGVCGGTFPCGTKIGESAKTSTGGLYLNPGDTSAYVRDWAVGSEYTNFAFRASADSAVPEPATWAMMLLGFGVIGGAMRSCRQQAKVRFAF